MPRNHYLQSQFLEFDIIGVAVLPHTIDYNGKPAYDTDNVTLRDNG